MDQTTSMAWYVHPDRRSSLVNRSAILTAHSCCALPTEQFTDIKGEIILPDAGVPKLKLNEVHRVKEHKLSEKDIKKIKTEYRITIRNNQYLLIDIQDDTLVYIAATESTDVPPFGFRDKLVLKKGDIENLTESEISTTFGRYLLNYHLLVYPFVRSGQILKGLEYTNTVWPIKKLEKVIARYLIDKKVSTAQVKLYVNNGFRLSSIGEIAGATFTEKAIKPNPEIIKRKKELTKQYAGQLNDPRISAIIENELINMDKDYMKGDPSLAFYDTSSKNFSIRRKKQYIALGSLTRFGSAKGQYNFVEASLSEGITQEDFASACNDIRFASFSRGVETQVAGLDTKWMIAVFQNCKIVGDDCGTKRTLRVRPTSDSIDNYIGAYVRTGERQTFKPFPDTGKEEKTFISFQLGEPKYKEDDLVVTEDKLRYKIISVQHYTDIKLCQDKTGLSPIDIVKLEDKPVTRYMLEKVIIADGFTPITDDNKSKFINKEIEIRSMQFCQQAHGFCRVCACETFSKLDVDNIGTQPIDVGGIFLNLSMKAMHGTELKSFRIEDPEDLLEYFV